MPTMTAQTQWQRTDDSETRDWRHWLSRQHTRTTETETTSHSYDAVTSDMQQTDAITTEQAKMALPTKPQTKFKFSSTCMEVIHIAATVRTQKQPQPLQKRRKCHVSPEQRPQSRQTQLTQRAHPKLPASHGTYTAIHVTSAFISIRDTL